MRPTTLTILPALPTCRRTGDKCLTPYSIVRQASTTTLYIHFAVQSSLLQAGSMLVPVEGAETALCVLLPRPFLVSHRLMSRANVYVMPYEGPTPVPAWRSLDSHIRLGVDKAPTTQGVASHLWLATCGHVTGSLLYTSKLKQLPICQLQDVACSAERVGRSSHARSPRSSISNSLS